MYGHLSKWALFNRRLKAHFLSARPWLHSTSKFSLLKHSAEIFLFLYWSPDVFYFFYNCYFCLLSCFPIADHIQPYVHSGDSFHIWCSEHSFRQSINIVAWFFLQSWISWTSELTETIHLPNCSYYILILICSNVYVWSSWWLLGTTQTLRASLML